MLIGVIGPELDDIELVCELLTLDRTIQEFDFNRFLRFTENNIRNCVVASETHRECLIKIIEKQFRTVLLTGNIVFSQSLCEKFLAQGGILVIVSRGGNDDQTLRFNKLHKDLVKRNSQNLYFVDISQENSEELNALLEESITWEDTPEDMLLDEEGAFESINNTIIRKDSATMTIEESIEKAMKELGLTLPEETEVSPVSASTASNPKKKEKIKKSEVVTSKKEVGNSPKVQQDLQSIFVKFSEDSMAVLIPEDLSLTKQVIGGINFNVATVGIPDFTDKNLQELHCQPVSVNDKTEPQIENKTQNVTKTKRVEKNPVATSEDLESLKQVKAELDQKIKEARQQGDTEEVNALRKQRRAIRAKINKLKH